ncbi:MAG: hypothetical protein DRH97_01920 [Chloroflexi bacterium]|nr:MAG: hypothetical protein DRH97_01920 [Chloroflexota bacterium]
MKTFENRQTEIHYEGEQEKLKFSHLAGQLLTITPAGGKWHPNEMRLRFKIQDKLVAGVNDETIELEDAELDKLHELSQDGFNFAHKDILAFADHLEELKKS